jgi:hypothetical protein
MSRLLVAGAAMLPAAWLYAQAAYGHTVLSPTTAVGTATLVAIAWAAAEYTVRVPTNRWIVGRLALTPVEMQALWVGATLLTSALISR